MGARGVQWPEADLSVSQPQNHHPDFSFALQQSNNKGTGGRPPIGGTDQIKTLVSPTEGIAMQNEADLNWPKSVEIQNRSTR